jgi:hypothetical protein
MENNQWYCKTYNFKIKFTNYMNEIKKKINIKRARKRLII